MFYPDSSISSIPANAFNQYFTTQTFPVDGTLQVISLNNIKQYEMDIKDSKPDEFRLWEGRHALYDGDEIICVDWYLVTTYYYANGTTQVFEEFLFTQCYGGSGGGSGGGGGGNGITPPVLNHYPVTKQVRFIVASLLTSYEGWTVYADYYLHGEYFPNNSAHSYFTSSPESIDGSGASTSHMVFESGFMHSVASHVWYLNFQLSANNVSLLNNNKTAKAQFSAILSFPNQSPVFYRYPGNTKHWQASIALH
ncbi:MAG: hypothetical protein EOO03_08675 [Chitinophagaceae bacterium]|nr:MAG: hypothetical protein EOO03_08675 [Chitinophagaceae bacterium]